MKNNLHDDDLNVFISFLFIFSFHTSNDEEDDENGTSVKYKYEEENKNCWKETILSKEQRNEQKEEERNIYLLIKYIEMTTCR